MDGIAKRKLNFAPFQRQQRAIDRLLREGRFRNTTEFLRAAIDHYLDNLGRPTLSEQARQMAEDFRLEARDRAGTEAEAEALQYASMSSDESW